MVELIAKWLFEKYSQLFVKYTTKEFTFQEAMKILHEDDKAYMSLILSELRKAGWLQIKIDQQDARRRIYNLITLTHIVNTIAKNRNVREGMERQNDKIQIA